MAKAKRQAQTKLLPLTPEQAAALSDLVSRFQVIVKAKGEASEKAESMLDQFRAFAVEINQLLWWHYLNGLANQATIRNAFAFRRSTLGTIKRFHLRRDVTIDDLVKAYSEAGEVSQLCVTAFTADLQAMAEDRAERSQARTGKPRGSRRRRKAIYCIGS